MAFTSWHQSAPDRNPAAMEKGSGGRVNTGANHEIQDRRGKA